MTKYPVWPRLHVAATTLLFSAFAVSATAQTLRFNAHRDYPSGYGPASIAVGDINGDQRPDLAVAQGFSDTVAVLLGNANGTFQAPRTVYLGPSNSPRSVAIGDVNGDGRPDLAVANPMSNTVSLLLGNGDGTFQPTVTLGAGLSPNSVAVGDFNGDTRLDLAVGNGGSNNVSILIGGGDGTFQPARNFAADAGPASVAVGDFNLDNRADLAVGNNVSGTVSTLLGNGDGTFQAPQNIASGPATLGVAVGDLNGDGIQDLAAANNGIGANTVAVMLGNGNGTFRPALLATVGNGPTAIAVGDYNRDSRSDLAVSSYQPATSSGHHVSVLLGQGDGTFQTARVFAAGYESLSVAAGDFNGDAALDLAVANTFSTTVSVLLNNGDATFPSTPTYGVGRNPESVVVSDFNRDGRVDMAVANAGSHTVSLMLGNGDSTFQAAVTYPTGRGPTSVALGDFNGDGFGDLVTSNFGSADYYSPLLWTTVSVLVGNGDGTFRPAQDFEAGGGPNAVAIGDFNGDGRQDLAVAVYGAYPQRGNTIAILLGNGDATFRPPQTIQVGVGPSYVAAGDFNRDGRTDLAVSNYNDGNVSILIGNGDGTFVVLGTVPVGAAPWFIVVDDFNGDQMPDLAVTGHWSDIVSIVPGNGNGTFQPHLWHLTGRGPTGIAVADLNGDGRRDLAVANYFSTTISVLLSNGDGTLSAADDFAVDMAPMSVAAADFNGDGQRDLATANYFASSVSVLTNRTFAPRAVAPTFTPAGGTYVGSVAVALSTTTPGATIHYTTDGSTPTLGSPVYTSPIVLTRSTTIAAIAVASGMTDSEVRFATYTVQAVPPVFSVPAGTYNQPQSVALSTPTSGATIRYTTDGSTPTTASAVYAGPIAVTQTTTIRAIAVASGMASSTVSSATYTLQAAAPSFTPPGGTYLLPQVVELSSASPGVTIYYTTNGSTPTTASTPYTGGFVVGIGTTTVRAIAVRSGWSQSAVASATYRIPF